MQDAIYNELDGLNRTFRSPSAPKFALFEQAARHSGVDPAFIDLVYNAGDLDVLNVKRASTWIEPGEIMDVPREIMDALGSIDRIVSFTKTAGEALADVELLRAKYAAGDERGGKGGKGGFDVKLAPLEVEPQTLSDAGQSVLGLSETPAADAQAFLGSAPPETGGSERRGLMDMLPGASRQMVSESGEQLRLKRLMQDKYIGGHSLPDVVDAYNAALAVNPNFGDAELVSYVRQHLGTKGGVPLDLQIRARGEDNNE
jgi:hypothetical protein